MILEGCQNRGERPQVKKAVPNIFFFPVRPAFHSLPPDERYSIGNFASSRHLARVNHPSRSEAAPMERNSMSIKYAHYEKKSVDPHNRLYDRHNGTPA